MKPQLQKLKQKKLIKLILYRKQKEPFQTNLTKLNSNTTMNDFKKIQSSFLSDVYSVKQNGGEEPIYKIFPGMRKELNSKMGIVASISNNNKTKKFAERQKAAKGKEQEDLDQLEYVPIMWHLQEVLYKEGRKFFNEVECLKYFATQFKDSRDTEKPETPDFYKDNCPDISLSLNGTVKEGDIQYIGINGIQAALRMSSE